MVDTSKLIRIFEQMGFGDVKLESSNELVASCIFCADEKRNFQANYKKNVYHCVSGDTLVHTARGRVPARTLAGKRVRVVSKNGRLRWANWHSFGVQRLFEILLDNGDKLYTTSDHEWVVNRTNKRIKTIDLVGEFIPTQHRLDSVAVKSNVEKKDYLEGLRNGMVFGDGTKYFRGRDSNIRQYGENICLLYTSPSARDS